MVPSYNNVLWWDRFVTLCTDAVVLNFPIYLDDYGGLQLKSAWDTLLGLVGQYASVVTIWVASLVNSTLSTAVSLADTNASSVAGPSMVVDVPSADSVASSVSVPMNNCASFLVSSSHCVACAYWKGK